ncbi:MAG: hypothetical protein RSA84_22535, partial [Acinetobacter sp.]
MPTMFDGIYIRDTLRDTGTIPSIDLAPTYSPDIICYQQQTLSYLDAKKTYEQNICKQFKQDFPNNIYVRAKNLSSTAKTSKVRAYYASLNILFTPNQWKPMNTMNPSSGLEPDLVYINGNTTIPAGQIAICRDAFYLMEVENPLLHHCILAMCSTYNTQTKTHSWPTPPTTFVNNQALWQFLRDEPRMAYNNIVIVQPTMQTVSKSVYYANNDDRERKFNVAISVTEGLDTLVGTKLMLQSTNVVNPFSVEQEIKAGQTNYSNEVILPAKFEGYFNFTCILGRSKAVKATLAVQNLLID